jgi:hypothetical protein
MAGITRRCVGGELRIDVIDPISEAYVTDAKLTSGERSLADYQVIVGLSLQPVKDFRSTTNAPERTSALADFHLNSVFSFWFRPDNIHSRSFD